MSLGSHIQELRKKHETLAHQVETAQRNPGVDPLEISHLKKQKLKLKEEIGKLSGTA